MVQRSKCEENLCTNVCYYSNIIFVRNYLNISFGLANVALFADSGCGNIPMYKNILDNKKEIKFLSNFFDKLLTSLVCSKTVIYCNLTHIIDNVLYNYQRVI